MSAECPKCGAHLVGVAKQDALGAPVLDYECPVCELAKARTEIERLRAEYACFQDLAGKNVAKMLREADRLKAEISDHAEWAKAFAADPKNAEIVYAQDELGVLREAVRLAKEALSQYERILRMARNGATQVEPGHTCGPEGNCDTECMAAAYDAQFLHERRKAWMALRKHLTDHGLLRKNATDKKPPGARYGMDENEFRAWEQASDEVYDPESRSDEREEGEGK